MKFAEHLAAHITPEWRKQYINYEEMKAMLYIAVEEAPSSEAVEPEELTRHFTKFDEHFFHYCDKELKKINTFYSVKINLSSSTQLKNAKIKTTEIPLAATINDLAIDREKLAEATRKFATLRSELESSVDQKGRVRKSKEVPARKLNDLKLAFSEFYLSLILLQNYQNLNHTGFRKILKKHDKLLTTDIGAKYRTEQVEMSHFYTNKDITKLITETEATVIQELEGGDRQKAMKRLRVPPLGEKQSPWTTFKVGLFSGSFVVLFIAVVLSAVFHDNGTSNLNIAFMLYRGPLLIVEFLFLIGVNVYGWRSSGVNHVLIFELDPRNHLSEQHLMEMAAILGVVWTLSLLSFLYSASLSIPPYVNPLSLVFIFIVFTINPVKTFRHEARFWVLRIIGRMLAAPFFHVGFADFWLADQLNSLVTVLLDLHFLVCFYISNGDWLAAGEFQKCSGSDFLITKSIVNCIPAWIRFAQCLRRYRDSKEAFPHLVNAGKYSTTFFVVVFATLKVLKAGDYDSTWDNPYLYLWLVSSLVSSIYAYTWDIKMDWGLLDDSAGENWFLREEVVYSSTSFYYFAVIEDLVLRFSWIVSFALVEAGICSPDIVTSITAPLEVFRRFVWNFFRLENEHLNNCGKFRAVRDISVAPLDSSDHTQLIRMMDEENGVVNRRPPKKHPKKMSKDDKKPLFIKEKESTSDLQLVIPDL